MSDHKKDISTAKNKVFAQGAESLREWREAQKRVLRRIEDLIAEAHGLKQSLDETEDIDDSAASERKSIREHIQELSELTLSTRLTDK